MFSKTSARLGDGFTFFFSKLKVKALLVHRYILVHFPTFSFMLVDELNIRMQDNQSSGQYDVNDATLKFVKRRDDISKCTPQHFCIRELMGE